MTSIKVGWLASTKTLRQFLNLSAPITSSRMTPVVCINHKKMPNTLLTTQRARIDFFGPETICIKGKTTSDKSNAPKPKAKKQPPVAISRQ